MFIVSTDFDYSHYCDPSNLTLNSVKMKKIALIHTILILSILISNVYSQFTHTFTQIASLSHVGYPWGVTIGPDGTVFVANTDGGLCAYEYNGGKLKKTAYVNNGGFAMNVAIGHDGTVFLANENELHIRS